MTVMRPDGRFMGIPPISVMLIMALISVIGIALIPRLNIQYLPESGGRSVSVSYEMRKSTADEMEAEVTSRLEKVLSCISGVNDIYSVSKNGSGRIKLKFDRGTDMDAARLQISSAIRSLYPSLPDDVTYPRISSSSSDKSVSLSYIFKGGVSSEEISTYIEDRITPALSAVEGVNAVTLSGVVPHRMTVTFDALQARTLGISAADIAAAFDAGMTDVPIGNIVSDNEFLPVRLSTGLKEKMDRMPVAAVSGRIYHLSDIATFSFDEVTPDSYFRVNGLNAVTMNITVVSDVNLLRTASSVRNRMTDVISALPQGISAHLAYDSSDMVNKELSKIYIRTCLCIALLLLFVLLSYRSWKYLLTVVITLAVNVLSAVAIYAVSGLPIHIYTLAGITVSMGIIIDASIITVDHYIRYGDRRYFSELLPAVGTTIAALLSVLMLPEDVKLNYTDFIRVIVINLTLSLPVSLLFVPALLDFLPERMKYRPVFVSGCKPLKKRDTLYLKYVTGIQSHRWTVLLVCLLSFGIPTFLIPDEVVRWRFYANNRETIDGVLGSSFALFNRALERSDFSKNPGNEKLYISSGMSDGCTIEQMNDIVREMENYLFQFDDIKVFISEVNGPDDAEIIVEFSDDVSRTPFPAWLQGKVTQYAIKLGGANWRVSGVTNDSFSNFVNAKMMSGEFTMTGYDYGRLRRYAEHLVDHISRNPRVSIAQIWTTDSYTPPSSFYALDFDFDRVSRNNVSLNPYFSTLSSVLTDRSIGRYIIGGRPVEVALKSSEKGKYELWDIQNAPLEIDSVSVSLNSIGSITKKESGINISRHNQNYEMDVKFQFAGSPTMQRKFEEATLDYMKSSVLPVGFDITTPRWSFYMDKETYYFLILIIVAILFVILSISFESLRYPTAIILMIPFAFVGLFLTFGLNGFCFDQGGFASLIMIAGITVNPGIYIITELKRLKARFPGKTSAELYVQAYRNKITPILLTLTSTVLGITPFLFDGPSEVFWFAFSIGTISGTLFSLLSILFVLPLYSVDKQSRAI